MQSRVVLALLPLFLLTLAGLQAAPVILVDHGDDWRYRKGTNEPQVGWQTLTDAELDATWLTGGGGFGYGDGDDVTVLGDMQNNYTTVYIRRTFTIAAPIDAGLLVKLMVDWDDAYVAYLDGAEVGRDRAPGAIGDPVPYDAEGTSDHAASVEGGAVAILTLGEGASLLPPGDHVLALIGINGDPPSSDLSLIADLILEEDITEDVTWALADSPIQITSSYTVPVGATLTIEPGVEVRFNSGTSLTVNGRLLAEGTASDRILFAGNGGASWSGIRFRNTPEDNRVTYADIDRAASADPIDVGDSRLLVDHVTFVNTTRTIIELANATAIIRNSVFPTIINNETIHGNGMPANGYVIIESNYFGSTTGYSDIIDFSGGQRPGPILQIYHNTFNGGSDDVLDLDGTDAHIEGNVFMNIHQDGARDSGSYAIATDAGTDVTVVRNLFYDVDHAMLLKNGATAVFHNNTVVLTRTNAVSEYPAAVVSFGEPLRNVRGGGGADLDGNIFWNIDRDLHFLFFTNGVMTLSVNHSILSGTNHPGMGNLSADPLFANLAGITPETIHQDLALLPGSPALGTGPNGLDMGGLVPGGASISGEPDSPTTNTSATLVIGGPGMVSYRYSLNGGAYGPETNLGVPIQLDGLAPGDYSVEVIGRNSAGVWQDMAEATVSRAWTVEAEGEVTLSQVSYDAGTMTFAFEFGGVAGSSYTVQFTDSLTPPDWQRLQDINAITTGPVLIQDAVADVPVRFYRVVSPALP